MSLLVRLHDLQNHMNYTFIFNDQDMSKFQKNYDDTVGSEMRDPKKWLDIFISEVLPRFFSLDEKEKNNLNNNVVMTTLDCIMKYVFSFEEKCGIPMDTIEIFKFTTNDSEDYYHILLNNKVTMKS